MQQNLDNFDDLFKKAFEDHEVAPPTHLWDNIESELPPASDDLIFRRAFMNHEVEPSPKVWQNVSRRLPISLVLKRHLTMLSRVAAVLLVFMFGMMLFDQFSNPFTRGNNDIQADVNDISKDANLTEQSGLDVPSTSNKPSTTDFTPQQTVDAPSTQVRPRIPNVLKEAQAERASFVPVNETNISSKDNKDANNGRTAVQQALENASETKKLETKTAVPIAALNSIRPLDARDFVNGTINSSVLVSDEIAVSNALSGFIENISLERRAEKEIAANKDEFFRKEAMNYQGWYVSASTQWSNSWILSNDISEQMGTAADYALDYGKMFGLSGGYKLNNKLAVEFGVNYSTQGQRYREILNGERITCADLTYVQVPIAVKYRKNEISSEKPASVSYVAGIQYGRAVQSPSFVSTLNGEPVNAPAVNQNLFVTNELGVVAGLDYDVYLNKNWSLSVGGRASVGTEVSQMFANGSSYNALFGVRAGVNYRFTD